MASLPGLPRCCQSGDHGSQVGEQDSGPERWAASLRGRWETPDISSCPGLGPRAPASACSLTLTPRVPTLRLRHPPVGTQGPRGGCALPSTIAGVQAPLGGPGAPLRCRSGLGTTDVLALACQAAYSWNTRRFRPQSRELEAARLLVPEPGGNSELACAEGCRGRPPGVPSGPVWAPWKATFSSPSWGSWPGKLGGYGN